MADYSMMKLGKLPPKRDKRMLTFSKYTTKLAPAPAVCDTLQNKVTNLGMMLNDQLGDCTCAAVGHMVQLWTAENGHMIVPTDGEVEKLYEIVGGYVPGDPSTDNGAACEDVLDYWEKHGFACNNTAEKILGYASADPTKPEEVKATVFYFGAGYLGVALPLSCQTQDVWEVVNDDGTGNTEPGSWGGHCICCVGYDASYVYFISWGKIMKMSWAFFAKYVEQVFPVFSELWLNNGKCPEGFALAELAEDLKAIHSL